MIYDLERLINTLHNTPSDINEHMPTIIKYGSECETITEMGVRGIFSTWGWLACFPKWLKCYDLHNPSKWGGDIQSVYDTANAYEIPFSFEENDVLKIEIEEKRNKMEAEHNAQQQDNGPITLQEPGKPPVVLKNSDVIKLINGLREQLKTITAKNSELLEIISIMQKKQISMKSEYDEELGKLKHTNECLKDKIAIDATTARLGKL